jgi:Holliday junction resolvasome RuvABC DNA-binding subunit
LWNAGYVTKEKLAAAAMGDLMRVPGIGPGVAESILRELAQQGVQAAQEKVPSPARSGQLDLGDFI